MIHKLVNNAVPGAEVIISICNGGVDECKEEKKTEKRKMAVEGKPEQSSSCSISDGVKRLLCLCCMG
jgi:hypothetical protein